MNPLRRIVSEAHRRSLWQVLGIYLVGSWIGYQVILNLMQGFGLPDWVAPFALVLFVIGLPIVIATAFVQEGLPEAADFKQRAGERELRAADPHDLVPGFSTAADELNEAPGPGVRDRDRDHDRPSAAAPSGVNRHLTWPKALLGGMAAFLVLAVSTAGYMGLRNAGVGPMGSLLGKGELSERDAIVLAQFTSGAGDDVLASALTEAFRVDFEQSPVVRLVGSQQVTDVLRRMQRDATEPLTESLAREIAEREGYKAVLTGEVNQVGAGYVLSARLLAADGRVLASARETAADSTHVLTAIDGLSKTLRERIGESLRSIRANPPLEQVTTASVEALRLYTQAQRVRDEGDALHAIELLQQAIAIDSGFAMAYRKIGAITVGPGMDPDLRVRATTRAYELRERLTQEEQHLAAAAYFSWVAGDGDAAMREYRSVLAIDPDNAAALNNLANLYGERAQYEESARLLGRAVEVGGSAVFMQNYSEALYSIGRIDEARAMLDSANAVYPANRVIDLYKAGLESALGRYDASDSLVKAPDALSSPDANLVTGLHWTVSANAAVRGQLREARRAVRAMERLAATYSPAEALNSVLWGAHVEFALTGDRAAAVAAIDAALQRYPLARMEPLQRPYFPLITLLQYAGEDARAAALIAERASSIPAVDRGAQRMEEMRVEMLGRLAAGQIDDADAILVESQPIASCDLCMVEPVAAAQARAGNDARAIELYEAYLADRYFWRLEADALELPKVLVGAAEAYERRGDTENAARMYARFIELWQDADPELQPRVRAARERLQAIVQRRG